jgi:DNA-binding IclR family transcriptional regulator
MVIRNEDATYSLGLEFLQLAARASAKLSIQDIALPVLRGLVAEIDETAMLALYEPRRRQLMFALAVESTHPLRYFIALNEWAPAHSGASGMAVCAWVSPDDRAAIIAAANPPLTAAELDRRIEDLKWIRHAGYAVSHGQRIQGAIGIAAPIFDGATKVIGTTALSIPEQRFQVGAQADIGRRVNAAASRITHGIGGRAPAPD